MLELTEITLKRDDKLLFDAMDLTIHAEHKVGIVGRNGAGKTTLADIIRGRLIPEDGDVRFPREWRLAWLDQNVAPSSRAALAFAIDGDRTLRKVERQIGDAEARGDDEALAHLYTVLEDVGGYDAEARAGEILHGLGFDKDDFTKPHETFSGGWRIRLNLARTLMTPSDLLILDEPTNHLDLDATLWLESWLARYPGTLLIIAHDRDFLDNVVQEIVHLHATKATVYSGNYSSFERQRAEALTRQAVTYRKQQQEVERIEKFVRRFRAKASKAKQVQSRVKALERMERVAAVHAESPYRFEFTTAEKISNPLVMLDDAAIGYDGEAIADHIDLRIYPGSRIGILGVNGAGKSTLLKTLAGELDLVGGELVAGQHAKVAYFAQHQMESLDLDASALVTLTQAYPMNEQAGRNYLGGWGFSGDMVHRPVRTFSGGEKARLVLALLAKSEPAMLLLDEPTNHLDIEMREALAIALQSFRGALLIVSHDRNLLRECVDDFWIVDDARVGPYTRTLDEYAEFREENGGARRGGGHAKAEVRRQKAARREALKPLTQKAKRLEKEIDRVQAELAEIGETLADTATYAELDPDELTTLLTRDGKLRARLETIEAEWFGVQEQLEALANGNSTPQRAARN